MIIANKFKKSVLCLIFISYIIKISYSKNIVYYYNYMHNKTLVNSFYMIRNGKPFWINDSASHFSLKTELTSLIDSADLGSYRKTFDFLRSRLIINWEKNPYTIMNLDRLYTDAAFVYLKNLYQGDDTFKFLQYDEVAKKYEEKDNKYLVNILTKDSTAELLKETINQLEPTDTIYHLLKEELEKELPAKDALKIKQLKTSLNFNRWIHHFSLEKYIVVNIAAATLKYYENDTVQLQIKVVVGKKATKTPRFAVYCDQIILYPYWNVPRSIAINELLPICKRSYSILDIMNIQVLNQHGTVLDPKKLNWKTFNASNFPYYFRQSTGCNNALGVIKFNLTDPYNVYMHDTNLKNAFQSDKRFFSHGCIRVEKPIGLGNKLLPENLDSNFLAACLKNQLPIIKQIDKPVPVFVVYLTVDEENGSIKYYPDVYQLL